MDNLDEILLNALDEFGIKFNRDVVNDFRAYFEELVEYNSHTNLTAITEPREIYIKHFVDSISALLAFDFLKKKFDFDAKKSKIIDVGSGAGFPALPVKIVDKDLDITLLDSLNKRTKFLNIVSDRLLLDKIEILHKRAEDGAREERLREKFDIVLSRAVANLPVLLEYSLPFLKKDGFMVCLKGPMVNEEIEKSAKALNILGGKVEEIIDVKIPFSDLNHKILIIKKIKNTGKNYPRKAGIPSKEPLV